ncbi:MAG: CotH kinase family protein, partial [Anaerolineae bacterium]
MKRFLVPIALLLAVGLVLVLAQAVEQRARTSASGPGPGRPAISPPPGSYPRGTSVSLQASQPRAEIVFTTDGTVPTAAVGHRYDTPLRLDAAFPGVTTLRAVEVLGGETGPVLNATYLVGFEPTLPVVAITAEPADLWDAERGLFVNTSWRGADWERPVHVTGFLDGAVAFSEPAGMRIDGREPWTAEKQSLRLYFRQAYGAGRISAPLFPGHLHQPAQDQVYKRLLLQAGVRDPRWSLLRDHLVSEAARAMGFPLAEGRFVWLFVNDVSWGVYRLTERVDRFFLEDNLAIASADVVREGDAREGTDEAWEALVDFVESHNLGDVAHY